MTMHTCSSLFDNDYREVIGSDIHAGKRNVIAAVGTRAAKGKVVPLYASSLVA